MTATWNTTMDHWIILSRCNRLGEQLFSKDRQSADELARLAYQYWTLEGITLEQLRDRRAPGMSSHRKLRKWKQLQAKDFIAGT